MPALQRISPDRTASPSSDEISSATTTRTPSPSLSLEQEPHAILTSQSMELDSRQELPQNRLGVFKKIVVGLIFACFLVYVIVDFCTTKTLLKAGDSFLEWVGGHPYGGMFACVAVFFVATILFIPGLVLTLGSGYVFGNAFGVGWGVFIGSISVFLGAGLGAIGSFFIGRYLLRDSVKKLTRKYALFQALDVSWKENGFRLMSLLRLSPIIPFNAINYIAGVTAISFRAYFWAIFASLPGIVVFVFLGASANSLTPGHNSNNESNDDDALDPTVNVIMLSLGSVIGVVAVGLASYYAKKELNKIMAARDAETECLQDIRDCFENETDDQAARYEAVRQSFQRVSKLLADPQSNLSILIYSLLDNEYDDESDDDPNDEVIKMI